MKSAPLCRDVNLTVFAGVLSSLTVHKPTRRSLIGLPAQVRRGCLTATHAGRAVNVSSAVPFESSETQLHLDCEQHENQSNKHIR